jgi:hypothetical protein
VEAVVSLTSYPARINSVHVVVRSLLAQSVQPIKIVLYLSMDQFANLDVPQSLRALESELFEVRMVPGDWRSYKKLLPALEDFSDLPIVTADDDTIYPRLWLEQLYTAHEADRGSILAHRATQIVLTAPGEFASYESWPWATTKSDPTLTFATGAGGILYPVGGLHENVREYALAARLAPTADDIWFKAMALLAGTPTRKIHDGPVDYPSVRSSQRTSLRSVNVAGGRNLDQAEAVWEHFDLWPLMTSVGARGNGIRQ